MQARMWRFNPGILTQACCGRRLGAGHADCCPRNWRRRLQRCCEDIIVLALVVLLVAGAASLGLYWLRADARPSLPDTLIIDDTRGPGQ